MSKPNDLPTWRTIRHSDFFRIFRTCLRTRQPQLDTAAVVVWAADKQAEERNNSIDDQLRQNDDEISRLKAELEKSVRKRKSREVIVESD